MTSPTIIEIQEGVPVRISTKALSSDLIETILRRKLLDMRQVADAEHGLEYEIQATNVCGQIVVSRDLLIRVTPKVPIGNLFRMLEVAYDLKSFNFAPGLVDIDALQDLYERLASILARRVLNRARKGLYRAYLTESAPLGCVRGRVDIRATSRLIATGTSAVHCEFQEHSADIEENQILAWTLNVLCRAALQREEVRALVRMARRIMVGSTTVVPMKGRDCLNRLYNRLNDDYRPLHGLCRFFLESLGPGIDRGEHEVMPYTVNMALLFESFVARWLRDHGPETQTVGIQHALRLSGTEVMEWNVDILIKDRSSGSPMAVLDTKYKRTPTPSTEDVQQVVAYAVGARVNKAFLVYPTAMINPFSVRVGDVMVRSASFDIGGDLESGGRALLNQLRLH